MYIINLRHSESSSNLWEDDIQYWIRENIFQMKNKVGTVQCAKETNKSKYAEEGGEGEEEDKIKLR